MRLFLGLQTLWFFFLAPFSHLLIDDVYSCKWCINDPILILEEFRSGNYVFGAHLVAAAAINYLPYKVSKGICNRFYTLSYRKKTF